MEIYKAVRKSSENVQDKIERDNLYSKRLESMDKLIYIIYRLG